MRPPLEQNGDVFRLELRREEISTLRWALLYLQYMCEDTREQRLFSWKIVDDMIALFSGIPEDEEQP